MNLIPIQDSWRSESFIPYHRQSDLCTLYKVGEGGRMFMPWESGHAEGSNVCPNSKIGWSQGISEV